MYGSFNPPLSMHLVVVTSGLMIEGTLKTRLRRLTDVLNEPTAEHLILYDATFMEFGSRRVVAGPGTAQIQFADVLFAHTTGPTESGTQMRVPKQPIPAVLIVSPFTVEGEVHLAYEAELHQGLDALTGRFVPVTRARYWAYSEAESPNDVDLLEVNHSKAHICIGADVAWLKEAPEAGPSGAPDAW
jgi:hypothetical protein